MKNQQEYSNNLNPNVKVILHKLSQYEVDKETLDLQGISDRIEELFQELKSEDLGELTANAIANKVFSQTQGEKFLDISAWCGQTNGAQLHTTIEKWLEQGNDTIRIKLSLAQSTFPFVTKEKMSNVLLAIVKRYPQFKNRIDEMIKRREEQGV